MEIVTRKIRTAFLLLATVLLGRTLFLRPGSASIQNFRHAQEFSDQSSAGSLLLAPLLLAAGLSVLSIFSKRKSYKYGFTSNIESDTLPAGLDENVVREISRLNNEPDWLLEFRLKAYAQLLKMEMPKFSPNFLHLPPIDLQSISFHSRPRRAKEGAVDPELLATFEKLGVPVFERERLAGIAVDAVLDSQSVYTSRNPELENLGVIFCSFNEAVQKRPDLVKRYLGSVVPASDNYFACLNSAVFSDGSFVYIPKGVKCPIELSTYFRMNASGTGQFERTLIVCENRGSVSYIEGCTAPARKEHPLHAAVVELVALEDAEIKYSTAQNWYAGDNETGEGGVLNLVTKRGICKGDRAKIIWTQVETGSAITWKYPSCILLGEGSHGEFHSVSVTDHYQQADTGTKMVHLGKNTSSKIVAKGISAGKSVNVYRGLVKFGPKATGCRNLSNCDSLILSDECTAVTLPTIVSGPTACNKLEHEATTSKLSGDQLLLMRSRGLSEQEASSFILEGFCRDVLTKLPLEFAQEAAKLLSVKLEGSVGLFCFVVYTAEVLQQNAKEDKLIAIPDRSSLPLRRPRFGRPLCL